MRLGTADVLVRAKTGNFDKDIDQSEKKFKQFGSSTDKVANKIAQSLFGIVIAAGAVSAATVKIGVNFEKEMAVVEAVSRASAKDFADLTAIAREMGSVTEWSATQSASALKFMSMAGFTAAQSIAALPGVLDLATAGQLDLARATDIATDTLTAMGLEVTDLARLNDVMIATTTRTNTNINMLGESFKYVAPIAGQLNYSIEQTSSMLGILANSGIKASDAGTDLRKAMLMTAKAVKSLGMDEGSDLIDVLKEMRKRQFSVNEVQSQFGIVATKSVLVLMKQIGAYEDLTKTLKNSKGEAKKVADIMRDTLSGSFKALGSSMEENALKLFNIMKDDLRDIVQLALETSKAFGKWVENTDAIVEFVEFLRDIKNIVVDISDFLDGNPVFEKGLTNFILGPMANLGDYKTYYTAIGMAQKGLIDYSEIATSTIEELDQLISKRKLISPIDLDIKKTKKYIAEIEKEIKGARYELEKETLTAELGRFKDKLKEFEEEKIAIKLDKEETQALFDEMDKMVADEKLELEADIQMEKLYAKMKEDLQKKQFKAQLEIEAEWEIEDLFDEMSTYVWPGEPEETKKAAMTIFDSAMEFQGGIQDVISKFEQIVNLPSSVIDAYTSLFETIGDFPAKLFESAANLKESIPKMVQGIVTTFKDLLPALPTMVTDIIDEFVAEVPKITEAFIDNIPKIVNAFVKAIPQLMKSGAASSLTMATGGMFDFGKLFGGGKSSAADAALISALEGSASSARSLMEDIKSWQRDIRFEKAEDPVLFLKDELSELAGDIAKETDSQKRIELMEKQWETTKDLYDVTKEQLDNLKESGNVVQNALDTLTLSGTTTTLAGAGERYAELLEAAKTGETGAVSDFVGYQEQYMSFLEASGVSGELMRERSIADLEMLNNIIDEKQKEYQTLQEAIEENTSETGLNTTGLDAVVAELEKITAAIGGIDTGLPSIGSGLGSVLGFAVGGGMGAAIGSIGGMFADGGYADQTSIFAEDGPEWAIPAANNSKNENFLKSVGIDKLIKAQSQQQRSVGTQTIILQMDGKEITRAVVKNVQSDRQSQQGLKRAVNASY